MTANRRDASKYKRRIPRITNSECCMSGVIVGTVPSVPWPTVPCWASGTGGSSAVICGRQCRQADSQREQFETSSEHGRLDGQRDVHNNACKKSTFNNAFFSSGDHTSLLLVRTYDDQEESCSDRFNCLAGSIGLARCYKFMVRPTQVSVLAFKS
ncbi:hypothetical protein CBL_05565 [Carabus blaptoides fortunei]